MLILRKNNEFRSVLKHRKAGIIGCAKNISHHTLDSTDLLDYYAIDSKARFCVEQHRCELYKKYNYKIQKPHTPITTKEPLCFQSNKNNDDLLESMTHFLLQQIVASFVFFKAKFNSLFLLKNKKI